MTTVDTVRTYWSASVRQWNIANALSVSRALLGITLPLWALGGEGLLLSVVVYAGISDGLDGWIARKRGEETPLGRVLDPIADKIFTDIFLIWLAAYTGLASMAVLAVVTMLYDIDNTYRRRFDIAQAFRGYDTKPSAPVTLLSKAKTAMLFYLMVFSLYPEWLILISLDTVIGICLALVVSSWLYNYRGRIVNLVF